MSTLFVWREKLREIYAKHSTYILKALQLILGLVLFGLINVNIGFMEMASSVFCTVGLAVICTFFPMIVMVTAAAVLILVHFYSLSLPIAAVSLVIFLVMYIFYFRFTRKNRIAVINAVPNGRAGYKSRRSDDRKYFCSSAHKITSWRKYSQI